MNIQIRHAQLLAIACTLLCTTKSAWAQAQAPTLFPVAQDEIFVENVSHPGRLSLGLFLNSLYPVGNAFTANRSGGQSVKMNLNLLTGFGTEIGYALSERYELTLSAGYELFSTQGNTSIGTQTELQTVRLRQVPLMLIGRYKFANQGFSPEVELGAGLGLGSIKASSSTVTIDDISQSARSYRAYAAGGAGYSWTESFSLHAKIGYAYMRFGESQIDLSNNLNITQSAALSGIFFRGLIRYNF